ncbi:MAG: EamA family transporter, partial [Moraxellaceae bacterium]
VSSGMSALIVSLTPLFALLFARLWGQPVLPRDGVGIALGLAGVAILNSGQVLSASPAGGVLLVLAALLWAFGSMWGKHLPQPPAFMAGALQMLVGGVALLVAGLLRGEQLPATVTPEALGAMAYLVVFGSLLGFTAYVWLLAHVRPALATSYAYVNPVVAVALGLWLGGEQVEAVEWAGMVVMLAGVVLVCWPGARPGRRGHGEAD